MLIPFQETYDFIFEETDPSLISQLATADNLSSYNAFKGFKPQGFCISDTYNHPVFKFPKPQIDTFKPDIIEINKQFQLLYSSNELKMLPWHYMIELVGDKYVVYNTRPIIYRYPLLSKNIQLDNSKLLSDIEIQEYIHIGIIGDSNIDIYSIELYNIIKQFCIIPIKKINKIYTSLDKLVIFLNIGKKIIQSKFLQELG